MKDKFDSSLTRDRACTHASFDRSNECERVKKGERRRSLDHGYELCLARNSRTLLYQQGKSNETSFGVPSGKGGSLVFMGGLFVLSIYSTYLILEVSWFCALSNI
ncbi:hypothetical protein L873DRAFT_1501567 [Choiromyces venosus 120613-1]|uniref:Uncharacterized protein n=1 Tax=Choiromyces venosus 120613-1 TaxID=1336337 RepID=A0A3N4J6L5_9PEZI|nr:hypothetical protein L873DRAFT_1501567 [Choiromyces venosus 120613-1]